MILSTIQSKIALLVRKIKFLKKLAETTQKKLFMLIKKPAGTVRIKKNALNKIKEEIIVVFTKTNILKACIKQTASLLKIKNFRNMLGGIMKI